MVRIVGIQRSEDVRGEFILLQNQGSMRVGLRGHAVLADCALSDPLFRDSIFVIDESVDLMPGQYALIRTCAGQAKWSRTGEGQHVVSLFMNRAERVWSVCEGPFMVLSPQHVYCERAAEPICL